MKPGAQRNACELCRLAHGLCAVCRATRSEARLAARMSRIAAGICTDCPSKAVKGLTRCKRCRAANNAQSAAAHGRARAARARERAKSRPTPEQLAAARKARRAASAAKLSGYRCDRCRYSSARCESCRAERVAADRRRRELRRALGMCARCSEDAVPGHTLCARHRGVNNARSAAHARRRRQRLRQQNAA